MVRMLESDHVPIERAIELIGDGPRIHTFRNTGNILIGADWDREDLIAAMRKAGAILITGPMAQRALHGLAISEGGSPLFIETTERTDEGEEVLP
jgi:hypothetical protein